MFDSLSDWSVLALALLSAFLLIWLGLGINRWWRQSSADRERFEAIEKEILTLDPDERALLGYLLKHKQQAFSAVMGDATVAKLVSRGLVLEGDMLDATAYPHAIPNEVWMVAAMYRKKLSPPDQRPFSLTTRKPVNRPNKTNRA